MTKTRKRCSFSHDFKFLGTVSFQNADSFAQFTVESCQKCGLTEFWINKAGKTSQDTPSVDTKTTKKVEFDPAIR